MGALRQKSARNEARRKAEVKELQDKLAQQRALRQGELSRLRLEFEEFVHERIEKVLEGVEDMKQNERYDDSTQKEKIEAITSEVDRLKSGLYTVQLSWS